MLVDNSALPLYRSQQSSQVLLCLGGAASQPARPDPQLEDFTIEYVPRSSTPHARSFSENLRVTFEDQQKLRSVPWPLASRFRVSAKGKRIEAFPSPTFRKVPLNMKPESPPPIGPP
jgi:hypothetical protein